MKQKYKNITIIIVALSLILGSYLYINVKNKTINKLEEEVKDVKSKNKSLNMYIGVFQDENYILDKASDILKRKREALKKENEEKREEFTRAKERLDESNEQLEQNKKVINQIQEVRGTISYDSGVADKIYNYYKSKGWSNDVSKKAVALAFGESSLNCTRVNTSDPHGGSFGLFQINGVHRKRFTGNLLDCDYNIEVSEILAREQGFKIWGAYGGDNYTSFLNRYNK